METMALDTKSSLNPKGGLALFVKAPAKLSEQAVQPGGDSLFAGMFGEKISQTPPLNSTSDPAIATPGGKHRIKRLAGDAASEMITAPKVLDIETPSLLEALKLRKKSISVTEGAEPAEEAKTAIDLPKEMAEKGVLQIETPCELGAALFAQAVKPQEAAHLESETGGALARNPMAAAPTTPAAPATPASHPDTAAQRNNDRPATDSALTRNPMAAAPAAPAAPATPASHPGAAAQQNNDRPATATPISDIRQANPPRHDLGKRLGESKEGASIATTPQKPISEAGDGNTAIDPAASGRVTSAGSPDKTVLIRDAATETPSPVHDHQQLRSTISSSRTKLSEYDMSAFRVEMPHTSSSQETRPSAAIGATGVDMQSVIDQIVEARQGSGNDFGRMRIMLNPPNLGNVDLDIVVRGERVNLVMTAENATVQQALQSRGDDIRMALQRHDLKIEGFQVLLQENGTSQQQTNGGEMFRQNREPRERFIANEDAAAVFPVFSPIAEVRSAAGLVSIFA